MLWSNTINNSLLDQGANGLAATSRAYDINDSGLIVGNTLDVGSSEKRGSYWLYSTWQSNFSVVNAGQNFAVTDSNITSINDQGIMVGHQILQEYTTGGTPTNNYYTNIFMHQAFAGDAIFASTPELFTSNQHIPASINNINLYAGTGRFNGFEGDAGGINELPTFVSIADRNDNNSMVGMDDAGLCKVVSLQSGVIPSHSFSNDTGAPCLPDSINNNDVVVGRYEVDVALNTPHAFVYEYTPTAQCTSGFRDLNDFTLLPDGVVLAQATDVNESGVIVAKGEVNGLTRAYLLTPAAESAPIPTQLDINNNGVIDACETSPANDTPIDVAVLMVIINSILL